MILYQGMLLSVKMHLLVILLYKWSQHGFIRKVCSLLQPLTVGMDEASWENRSKEDFKYLLPSCRILVTTSSSQGDMLYWCSGRQSPANLVLHMAPEVLNLFQIYRATGLKSTFQWKEKWHCSHYKKGSKCKKKPEIFAVLVCLDPGCRYTK